MPFLPMCQSPSDPIEHTPFLSRAVASDQLSQIHELSRDLERLARWVWDAGFCHVVEQAIGSSATILPKDLLRTQFSDK